MKNTLANVVETRTFEDRGETRIIAEWNLREDDGEVWLDVEDEAGYSDTFHIGWIGNIDENSVPDELAGEFLDLVREWNLPNYV